MKGVRVDVQVDIRFHVGYVILRLEIEIAYSPLYYLVSVNEQIATGIGA
jgi:hypothetical protein